MEFEFIYLYPRFDVRGGILKTKTSCLTSKIAS